MKVTAIHSPLKKISADMYAAFTFQDAELFKQSIKQLQDDFASALSDAILLKDFSGKENETLLLYSHNKKIPRLLLVGLGESEKFTLEKLRRASATAAKQGKKLKSATLIIQFPEVKHALKESVEEISVALTEGALLSLYKYDKYISKEKNEKQLQKIFLLALAQNQITEITKGITAGTILAEATIHARNLQNAPGSEIFPETLANNAYAVARKNGFSATIFDKRKIQQLGMGGVIAVSKGSEKEPRFIILEYGKQFKNKGTVALVGKGVTFDTGGISIKPAANMAEMKMDMSGAAAVIGTFQAIAQLKVKKHVVGLIPSVENMPSGSAVKPGDIIRHYNGKTSEVDNTDAEGRLILADALSYAEKFKPEVVIDLATLTGACVVALGHYATGMMGNDDQIMDTLTKAGEKTYERVWQLPMFDEYEKLIKSDVADVKNVGGRWAGAITAAFFLKKFIGNYQWVHLDIAGTAILEEDQPYTPKGGSGVGVRLLVEFLQQWKK